MPVLPSGAVLKKGVDVASTNFAALFKELHDKKFTGYICLTIAARGIEEGCLLFDAGKPVAAMYEYFAHKKTLFAEAAYARIMNATAAQRGVMDICQLTSEQVQLTLAFNERAVYVPREAVPQPPPAFNAALEDEVVERWPTREALMASIGIGELTTARPPRELPRPELVKAPLDELKR